jgi:PAP2 superfamily
MTDKPESLQSVAHVHGARPPGHHEVIAPKTPSRSLSRRAFFRQMHGVTVATLAAGSVGTALLSRATRAWAQAAAMGPADLLTRRWQAYRLRQEAAMGHGNLPLPISPTNGDEAAYPTPIASFTKGLPHNALGEGDRTAYAALRAALTSGQATAFEALPLGGQVPLVNPQAAYAFALEGLDPHHVVVPAPPAFWSAEMAAEMVELYWQALTRDVPFAAYETHPLIQEATADLSRCSAFRGPRANGRVTPATLFRGPTPGDLTGPYLSQFLWLDVPSGMMTLVQRGRVPIAGDDYMTAYPDWLAIQRGMPPARPNVLDATPRYLRHGRDLSTYVHKDFTYQAFLNAGLILLAMRAPFQATNPYRHSRTQSGFVTFGAPHVLDLVGRVANAALKATWCQKWLMHRRLRPEEFAGRVHQTLTGAVRYPIHTDVLNAVAPSTLFHTTGTYLLPMAYPEGCPLHPAYPAGHAAIAGACATVLKAFFQTSFVISNPVEASADGLALLPYRGPDLTVGGELNKLASNIALGRDTAGVHWRSDGIEGIKLGEAVAIGILRDMRATYHEDFQGFSLTTFDGTTLTI